MRLFEHSSECSEEGTMQTWGAHKWGVDPDRESSMGMFLMWKMLEQLGASEAGCMHSSIHAVFDLCIF